jgi:phospholipase C
VENIFGLDPLTNRDKQANTLTHLLSLTAPRTDAPTALPDPPDSGFRCESDDAGKMAAGGPMLQAGRGEAKPGPIDPTLRGWLHVAFLRHHQLASDADRETIIKEFLNVRDRVDALTYMKRVNAMIGELKSKQGK